MEQIFIWRLPRGPCSVTISLSSRLCCKMTRGPGDALGPRGAPREGLMKEGIKHGRKER